MNDDDKELYGNESYDTNQENQDNYDVNNTDDYSDPNVDDTSYDDGNNDSYDDSNNDSYDYDSNDNNDGYNLDDIYAVDDDDDSNDDYSSYYSDDDDDKKSSLAESIKKYALWGVIAIVAIIAFLIFYVSFSGKGNNSDNSKRKMTLQAGDKYSLNVQDDSYSWNSSNKDVAIVTEDGQIEALKEGDATITIRVDNSTYTVDIHVEGSSIVVTQVDIDKEEIKLRIDEEYQLKATVLPAEVKNPGLSWHSSNERTVEVDSNGKVKAKAIGSSTIIVKSGNGNMDVCVVRVIAADEDEEIDDIVFDVNSVVLKQDVKYTLDYSVEPKSAKVKLNWESSDPSVATVEDGVINTLSPGTVAIVARKAGKSATLYVTVVKGDSSTPDVISDGKGPKAVSINVNQTELNMKIGTSYKLVSEVLPSDAADKTVTYKSANPGIATVDTIGNVTAVAYGETTITATAASGVSKDIRVLVTEQGGSFSIENITLSVNNITLSPGNELKLVATYSPSNANPEDLVWESSDENVATVDDGQVVAVGGGTAKITVSNGSGVSATCNITVSDSVQTATSIAVSPSTLSLRVNGATQLSVSFFPANVSNKTLVWSSSNKSVATVDANGLVYGKKKGHAVIFATTSNGIVGAVSVTVE